MCQIRTPIDVDMQVEMATVWGTTCDSHAGLETSWCLPNDAIATVHSQGAIALLHVDDMCRSRELVMSSESDVINVQQCDGTLAMDCGYGIIG